MKDNLRQGVLGLVSPAPGAPGRFNWKPALLFSAEKGTGSDEELNAKGLFRRRLLKEEEEAGGGVYLNDFRSGKESSKGVSFLALAETICGPSGFTVGAVALEWLGLVRPMSRPIREDKSPEQESLLNASERSGDGLLGLIRSSGEDKSLPSSGCCSIG